MTAVILQLQQDALDRDVPVSDLLRKALVIARKLALQEFQIWIENELKGYRNDQEAPDYRQVSGDVRGWNPYRGWMPLIFENPKAGESISRRKSTQSIAELEHLTQENVDSNFLHMPYSQATQRELSKGFGFDTQVSLFC